MGKMNTVIMCTNYDHHEDPVVMTRVEVTLKENSLEHKYECGRCGIDILVAKEATVEIIQRKNMRFRVSGSVKDGTAKFAYNDAFFWVDDDNQSRGPYKTQESAIMAGEQDILDKDISDML